MRAEISHGTYGGYQAHRKRGDTPCESCRLAKVEYTRKRRQRQPEIRKVEFARTAARNRALRRLAREYPDRFRELLIQEVRSQRKANPPRHED